MNDVNRREIYRYLGYGGSTPDAAVAEAVESCLEELRLAVTPRAVFRRYEIERIEEPAEPVADGASSEADSSPAASGGGPAWDTSIRGQERAAKVSIHGQNPAAKASIPGQDRAAKVSIPGQDRAAKASIPGQMPAVRESEKDLENRGHPEQGTHPQTQLLQIAGMKIRSRSLSINLRGCDSVYLMASTLGIGPDRLIARASVNRMSRAVIYQAAAAAMIEAWSDEVNSRIIQEAAKEGLFCRPRFSPGYGDFSLAYQSDFARILRIQKEIGVSLTESMLMMPSKSVTAVIGLSRRDEKCVLHGCEVCSKANGCAFSRMRGTAASGS